MSSLNSRASPNPLAAAVLRIRRTRDQLLGSDLFADPAWDILLNLSANGALSSAELAGRVGLSIEIVDRWTKVLVDEDLIEANEFGTLILTSAALRHLDRILQAAVSLAPAELRPTAR